MIGNVNCNEYKMCKITQLKYFVMSYDLFTYFQQLHIMPNLCVYNTILKRY